MNISELVPVRFELYPDHENYMKYAGKKYWISKLNVIAHEARLVKFYNESGDYVNECYGFRFQLVKDDIPDMRFVINEEMFTI